MAIISTVVIKWTNSGHTTYNIINENWAINSDVLPPTLNLNYECLIPVIPYSIPNYDPRIYNLITIKQPTSDPHPTYPTQNIWLITYDLEKKTDSEIKLNIENAKNIANQQTFPYEKQLEHLVVGLNALKKYVLGQNLSAVEQVVNNRITDYANALLANRNNEVLLSNIVDGGGEPNIDEGWATSISGGTGQ